MADVPGFLKLVLSGSQYVCVCVCVCVSVCVTINNWRHDVA